MLPTAFQGIRSRCASASVGLAVALWPVPGHGADAAGPAPSDSKQACLEHHEATQVLRIEGKLAEARDAARACAVQACPAALRSDCVSWMAELDELVPSTIPVAESESGELEEVRFFVDGALVRERLDGSAVELAPGEHVLRFEYGTEPALERRLTLREGEKNRIVRVRFPGVGRPPAPASPAPSAPVAPLQSAPVPEGARPIPLLSYVFGGVAVAAAATSSVIAVSAFGDRSQALDECAPLCSRDRVSSIRSRFILADVAAGVAIASAGFAVYFYVTRPVVPDHAGASFGFSRVGLRASDNGLRVSAEGAF